MNAMFEYIQAKKHAMEAQAKALAAGLNVKPKYEYDSDEDIEGGTWEHKRRVMEMEATRGRHWAQAAVVKNLSLSTHSQTCTSTMRNILVKW